MRTFTNLGTVAVLTIALTALFTGSASAQLSRVFVSGHSGSDSNPCNLAAPCRTFQHAHDTVAAGGEIEVLDTAGYGSVTIAKSITITNPGGVEAGVAANSGQDAVQINAGTSNINVTLRGLTLQGTNVGNNGIDWVSGGGNLNVIDCVAKDFVGDGIIIESASGSPNLEVTISKTTILSNADGIFINPQFGANQVIFSISDTISNMNKSTGISVSGSAISGTISLSHFEMNGTGLSLDATGVLTIVSSVFKDNSTTDITNSTGPGQTLYLYNANTIGAFGLVPGAITKSDGTNNIIAINGGGTVTKVAPQ